MNAANLKYMSLRGKRRKDGLQKLADDASLYASERGERYLPCYQQSEHRPIWVRKYEDGSCIRKPQPRCWRPEECVANKGQHGRDFASWQARNWYGQLVKALAAQVIDRTREERGLAPASWYELVLVVPSAPVVAPTPVSRLVYQDYERLFSAVLAVADKFRKRAGFQWGDLLNRRGRTRHGKARVPVVDARADEWLAEGYTRLVVPGRVSWRQWVKAGEEVARIRGVGLSKEREHTLRDRPFFLESFPPLADTLTPVPGGRLELVGEAPYTPCVAFQLLVYGPPVDLVRLEANWKRPERAGGHGTVELRTVTDPAQFVERVTGDQIRDQTAFPGEARALFDHLLAERDLKLCFHLGAGLGAQETVEKAWKRSGKRAFKEAAKAAGVNVDQTFELQPQLPDPGPLYKAIDVSRRRSELRQQYFDLMLERLLGEHRHKLSGTQRKIRQPGSRIDTEALVTVPLDKIMVSEGVSLRPSSFTQVDQSEEEMLNTVLLQRILDKLDRLPEQVATRVLELMGKDKSELSDEERQELANRIRTWVN